MAPHVWRRGAEGSPLGAYGNGGRGGGAEARACRWVHTHCCSALQIWGGVTTVVLDWGRRNGRGGSVRCWSGIGRREGRGQGRWSERGPEGDRNSGIEAGGTDACAGRGGRRLRHRVGARIEARVLIFLASVSCPEVWTHIELVFCVYVLIWTHDCVLL
ncbi:vegetative cell wall protein gp1-like [Iris pallida]|uniref:Vegetative cell wall protein gp1-like n=1 Tax=Iris pallida TaxID=29817 RepID=A0AAX6FCT5_IRIPA|nr:vegetative cell wall protein gp1-like [Iris pallida]